MLFPVFVHMYLELVYNGHEEVARNFLERLKGTQEECYQDDIHKLSLVTSRDHMSGYQIMDNFRCVCYASLLGSGHLILLFFSFTHIPHHEQPTHP